jgi:2-phosphosulfolactate phosphatase
VRIDVAALPLLLPAAPNSVCVVVDVLRASSTIATLIAGGAREVEVVASVEEALERRAALPNAFACGEVGGLPPPGFDYGNSPAEFARSEVAGRRAVLFTSNGTKALLRVAAAPAVYVGALLNRRAVAAAAVAAAQRLGCALTIVCSGTDLGAAFSFEDFFCAGALAAAACASLGAAAEPGDGAQAAIGVFERYGGDTRAAFLLAEHGRALVPLGLAEDLDFCAQFDRFPVAPLSRRDGRRVVVTSG